MQRRWLIFIASAAILSVTGSSKADDVRIRPGHYAHSLLVYGNAAERHAAGCLRWQVHNQAWYNHCVAGRQRPIAVKY